MRFNRKNSQFSIALLLGGLAIACFACAWPRMSRQLTVNSLTHCHVATVAGQAKARRLLNRLTPGAMTPDESICAVVWLDRERRVVVAKSDRMVKTVMITPTGRGKWSMPMRLSSDNPVTISHHDFTCLRLKGDVSTVHLAIAENSFVPVRYEVLGQVTPMRAKTSLEQWVDELYSEDVVRQLNALTSTPDDLSSQDRADLEPRLAQLRASAHPWVRQAAVAVSRPYVVPAFARANTWSDWIDN